MKNYNKKISVDIELVLLSVAYYAIVGKYKIPILWYLMQGPKGFNELHELFFHTSSSIFNKQLQELREEGLIKRKVCDELPLRVEYSLTENGEKLIPIFYSIMEWSENYIKTQNEERIPDIDFILDLDLWDKYLKVYEGSFIIEPEKLQNFRKKQ